MADVNLTATTLSVNGNDLTYTTIVTGNVYLVDNHPRLRIKAVESSASPQSYIVESTTTAQGQAVADRTVTVAASKSNMAGPFDARVFGQQLRITTASASGLDICALLT